MQLIKKETSGADVKTLQILLNQYYLGESACLITGIADGTTMFLLNKFQQERGLVVDGICGPRTWEILLAATEKLPKFMVSIHGGHGGYNPYTKNYDTLPSTGKRYHHKGLSVIDNHSTDGWFYEGIENRLIANSVADRLRRVGVFVLVTHHPYLCDYGKLSMHATQTKPYIEAGFTGYTHAFHSNAIGDTDYQKMESTVGGYVFTTEGLTLSDTVSAIHLQHWVKEFGDWVRLKGKGKVTESSDMEANFQVIRDVEKLGGKKFGAILEEFGFFTSAKDVVFITNPETRAKRVECAVQTALAVKQLLVK